MQRLLPSRSPPARKLLGALLTALQDLPENRYVELSTMLGERYGDFAGQRGLDPADLLPRLGLTHHKESTSQIVLALQAYFALVADLLAWAWAHESPADSFERLGLASGARIAELLSRLASGSAWYELGISCPTWPAATNWHQQLLGSKLEPHLAAFVSSLAGLWQGHTCLLPARDPLGSCYRQLMPRNLLHLMGETYTPWWLAEHLLEASGWNPSQSLLDPFAGSGVFILAALEHCAPQARLAVLENSSAIDINPLACRALRANLLASLKPCLQRATSTIHLPIWCQDALLDEPQTLEPAQVVLTNPPWVGWEYIPRSYRSKLHHLWQHYELFELSGRQAAFAKEDLSCLALVLAADRYLAPGGTLGSLVRPASMQSELAGRGLRRLHVKTIPLGLRCIDLFSDMRVFSGVTAPCATWLVKRNEETRFPVPVRAWLRSKKAWQPKLQDNLDSVRCNTTRAELAARPLDISDPSDRWLIAASETLSHVDKLLGKSAYRARTGVFTAGANGAYYLKRLGPGPGPATSSYRNLTGRTRRAVPSLEGAIEDELVYQIVRGRHVHSWLVTGHELLLCPHTASTRMSAISPSEMAKKYPLALAWLEKMRPALAKRRGFAAWERHQAEQAFYTIGRIGSYSFAPWKVAWRYIAQRFTLAVIGPDEAGRPRLVNDKVMAIGLDDQQEAFYVCGLLSALPVRLLIEALMSGTQISASIIEKLDLRSYCATNEHHREIAQACQAGHKAMAANQLSVARACAARIDEISCALYSLDPGQLESTQRTYPA